MQLIHITLTNFQHFIFLWYWFLFSSLFFTGNYKVLSTIAILSIWNEKIFFSQTAEIEQQMSNLLPNMMKQTGQIDIIQEENKRLYLDHMIEDQM